MRYIEIVLIIIASALFVSAVSFGYDNPNLPKVNSQAPVTTSVNNNTFNVNNTVCWQGYCTPQDFNQTQTIVNQNSSWLSTFNASYYLNSNPSNFINSTFNSTYANFSYNQTLAVFSLPILNATYYLASNPSNFINSSASSPFQVTSLTIFNNTVGVNFSLGNTTQRQKFAIFPDPNLGNYMAFDRIQVDSSTQAFSLNRITLNAVNNQSNEIFFRKQNNVGKTDYGILSGSSFYLIEQTNGDNFTFGQGNTYTGNGTVQVNVPLFRAVTATKRFGINTINPQTTLEVNGTGNFSGNLTVNSNTFFVNAELNKVGIGTGNPLSELTVIGDLNVTGEGNFTQVCISGNCQTSFSSTANINDTNVNLTNLLISQNLTVLGQLAVGLNVSINGSRLIMGGVSYTQPFAGYDNQGNALFEIGTGKLTVGDLNYSSIAFITNQAGNNNLIGNFFWLNTNLTTADKRIGQWTVNTDGAGNRSVFRFLTNNGVTLREVMRINANGSIGLGTTTPFHTLDVIGDGNFTGELNVSQLCIQGVCQTTFNSNANVNDTNVNLTSLKIANNLTVLGNESISGESLFKGGGNSSTTPFKVKVIRYGTNNIDAVGLDNSESGGGIPFKLGVILVDPTSGAPAVIFTNNSWTAQINALENGSLILVPQANGVIYLQGNTLPRANNSVDLGNQSKQWSSGIFANELNATTLCLSGVCQSSFSSTFPFIVNSTLVYNDTAGVNFGFGSSQPNYRVEINNNTKGLNVSNFLIVNGSSVGINTTAPIAKFQIGNNNAAGTPSAMPSNTGFFMNGLFDLRIGADDGDATYNGIFLKGDFQNSRSVGNIGTREAGVDYQMLSVVRQGIGIQTNFPHYALEINNASASLNVTNLLFVNSTGVGIGITNPNTALQVVGTTNLSGTTPLQVYRTTTNANPMVLFRGVTGGDSRSLFIIESTDNFNQRYLANFTGGGGSVYINSEGKLGINTGTPTHSLNVVGQTNITSNTIVQGNLTVVNTTEKNVLFIPRYSGTPFTCTTSTLGATYIDIGGDLFGGDAMCFCDLNGGSPQWTSTDMTYACA